VLVDKTSIFNGKCIDIMKLLGLKGRSLQPAESITTTMKPLNIKRGFGRYSKLREKCRGLFNQCATSTVSMRTLFVEC
jgi:hypothetical protein